MRRTARPETTSRLRRRTKSISDFGPMPPKRQFRQFTDNASSVRMLTSPLRRTAIPACSHGVPAPRRPAFAIGPLPSVSRVWTLREDKRGRLQARATDRAEPRTIPAGCGPERDVRMRLEKKRRRHSGPCAVPIRKSAYPDCSIATN
jgi:hypothetical protein